MPGSQRVVAVDAKAGYDEKDRGTLMAGIHTIHLGPTSDWALAVGNFDAQEQRHRVPAVKNAQPPGRDDEEGRAPHP